MHIELSRANPYRPADWRWQRASLLANDELTNSKLDDRDVKRAARAIRILLQTPENEGTLAFRDPDLYWSYRIYQGQHEFIAIRAELEARILAGDTDENIGKKCHLSPGGLRAYRELFFDVADRLECSACILHVIIGTALYRGYREQDINVFWKYYGYTYGVPVLEALITQVITPERAESSDDVARILQADCDSNILRKAAAASRTIRVNDFNAIDILNLVQKAKEIDKLAGGSGPNVGVDTAGLERILESVRFAIGEYAQDTIDVEVINRYDQSSSELTTQQLMAAATNNLPNNLETPPNLSYPELNHGS